MTSDEEWEAFYYESVGMKPPSKRNTDKEMTVEEFDAYLKTIDITDIFEKEKDVVGGEQ